MSRTPRSPFFGALLVSLCACDVSVGDGEDDLNAPAAAASAADGGDAPPDADAGADPLVPVASADGGSAAAPPASTLPPRRGVSRAWTRISNLAPIQDEVVTTVAVGGGLVFVGGRGGPQAHGFVAAVDGSSGVDRWTTPWGRAGAGGGVDALHLTRDGSVVAAARWTEADGGVGVETTRLTRDGAVERRGPSLLPGSEAPVRLAAGEGVTLLLHKTSTVVAPVGKRSRDTLAVIRPDLGPRASLDVETDAGGEAGAIAADAVGRPIVATTFRAGNPKGTLQVRKLSENGAPIWSWSTNVFGRLSALAPLPAGGAVLGGEIGTFGWIVRLDAAGKPLPSPTGDTLAVEEAARARVTGIAVDAAGNVIVAGTVTGAIAGGTSSGKDDAFVLELGPDGGLRWSHQFGWADDEAVAGVGVDEAGAIYVAGTSKNPTGSPGRAGQSRGFVVKLAPIFAP